MMNRWVLAGLCFMIFILFLLVKGCSPNANEESGMYNVHKLFDSQKAKNDHKATAKFAPEDGRIYSGAGQSIEAVSEMIHSADENHKPVIVALYDYMMSPASYITGADILEAPNLFPGAILQIGVVLPNQDVNELTRMGNGEYDDAIEQAARCYRDIRLPILLRIGVEFDAPWNPGYQPGPFIRTYRRIVDIFRANGADNVAFAWNSYTCDNRDMFRWYPDNPDTGEKDGDNYVDWFSFNVFTDSYDASWYMSQAKLHNKPVFIGEGGFGHTDQKSSFSEWINTYFQSMKQYGIKGHQYINWDWRLYPLWSTFKNARYTVDKQKTGLYNSLVADPVFLFRDDSYHDPVALFVDCARAMPNSENEGADWSKYWDHYTLKRGYDYKVEGATVSNGDNWWSKGWVSKEDWIKIKITLPEQSEGNLIFSVNPVNGYVVKAGGSMLVTVGKQKPVNVTEGYGFVKLPVFKTDISGTTLEMTIQGINGRVMVNNFGFLDYYEKCPDKPRFHSAKADADRNVGMAWARVKGAFFYNIYRNNQFIGRTRTESFTDSGPKAPGICTYTISAVNEYSGEGPMSQPVCVEIN